jgi:hypothetical protein
MVNAPKKYISSLPAGKYGILTKISIHPCNQANDGKSGWEGEGGRVLEGLRKVRSKQKLSAEK